MRIFALPKKITYFLLSFLAFGILFLSQSRLSLAQTYSSTPSFNTDSSVADTTHNRAQVILIDTLAAFTCQLSGTDPTRPDHKCLDVNTKTGVIGYATHSSGALGLLANAVGIMYSNMPAHVSDYVAYAKSNFGIVKNSYAAGPSSGYTGLSPMIGIWIAIRNVAYLFIVLIFIFIGFAIMLRVKIDPRTVMSIENQIPKIIIGLILITFSFAIAGFLIDIMYILIFIMYQIYQTIPVPNHNLTPGVLQANMPMGIVSGGYLNPQSDLLSTIFAGGNPYLLLVGHIASPLADFLRDLLNIPSFQNQGLGSGVGGGVLGGMINGFFSLISGGSTNLVSSFASGSPIGVAIDLVSMVTSAKIAISLAQFAQGEGTFMGVNVGQFFSPAVGVAVYTTLSTFFDFLLRDLAPTLLAFLVVYLAIVLAMLRLVFGLLTAWISILFSVALAPFQISLGLIPGAKGGFGDWLKGLAANLLVFPVTAGIFMLGSAMIQVFSAPNMPPFFMPPLLGGGSVPAGSLLGIIIIFAASQGPQMAKDMMQVKDENKYAGAFGALMGGSAKTLYKAGRATYAGFGKTPTPGQAGGFQGAMNVIG